MDRVDTKTLEIALEGSFHKDYAYTVRLDGCLLRKDYDFTPILSNEHIVGFKLTSKNAYPFGMKGLDFNGFRSHTRGAKWNSVMVWEEIG